MYPQPPRKGHPPLSSHLQKTSFIGLNSLRRITRRLSIGNKIRCGYALAISIAILGTSAGLSLGNYYENQAKEEAQKWHETGVLLGKLQVAVLQARSHQQQLIALLPQPKEFEKEYSHFHKHISEIKTLLSEVNSSTATKNIEEIKTFLQKYDGTVEAYLLQIDGLLQPNNPYKLQPKDIPNVQQLLLKLSVSETALKFDNLSDELTEITASAFEKERIAEEATEHGEMVQVCTPVVSMLLSVVIAILLAIYTSRAIARPLLATTEVAKIVTKDDNFDLQVPVTTEDEVGVLATSLNQLINRVKQLLEEQKAASERQHELQQTQLLQSEKMAGLGRMVAGIAHEINNPVNFIYGNITHAHEYFEELLELLETYQNEITQPPQIVQEKIEEIDLEFLQEDLPKVLESMKIGADRVREIVLSLKDFSRLDEAEAQSVDLHACINGTLLILHNRIKKGIKVICNYGNIPTIQGYTGFLSQVFMNLISNAIDALESTTETPEGEEKEIIITTENLDDNWVSLRFADNGCGIPPENLTIIFDTFFTTKPRGIGTGLGLAISRQIIEKKHNGRITCISQVGKGTEFAIALPVKQGGAEVRLSGGAKEQRSGGAGEPLSGGAEENFPVSSRRGGVTPPVPVPDHLLTT